jgi:hypothetical protein
MSPAIQRVCSARHQPCVLAILGAQIPALETITNPFELLLFIPIGLLALPLIAWTSSYWVVYGFIARRHPSRTMMVLFGCVLLGVDAYIRITAIFFPSGSTSALAIVFIPVVLGISVLPLYWGAGWLWSRLQRNRRGC